MSTRLTIATRTVAAGGVATAATACLAAIIAVLIGAMLLSFLGHDPGAALRVFFWQPFTSVYGAVEVLNKTTILAVIAIGLAVGFRAGIWNIGAEGQFIGGAIVGGAIGLTFSDNISAPLLLPLMLLGGVAGGALWAAIPAFLRAHFRTNEILTSLMLVYVAQLLLVYTVHGPLKDPAGYGFPRSELFSDAATLPTLTTGVRLYATVFLLPLVSLVFYFLFRRSYFAFQMRVVGMAPRAARFAGYSEKRTVWVAFLVAGGFAGLMGVCEVAGPIGQLTPVISPGYGFTAIIVAFLGRLHPLGIIPAAALMALAQIGGENGQIDLGLPVSVSGVFQGLTLFCLLAAEFFIGYKIMLSKGASKE